ncbi:MAG: HlyD family secretion protein [Desulforhopalus sp.]
MFELMFCAFFTILPDFLIKRFIQKKRWGKELTFFSIWYELRWGITGCAILTVSLITLVFYYHPSTTNVISMFRTVTILPETPGRVDEVLVENFQMVKKGDPLFRLDSSTQKSAVDTAQSTLDEIEAEFSLAKTDIEEAEGNISSVKSKLDQARSDLKRMLMITKGGEDLISERDIELYESRVEVIEGELVSAIARRAEALANLNTLLPARQDTAEDALAQAQVELEKMVVYADISGRVTQLVLQPGDIVNPLLRPAGLLVPEGDGSGKLAVQAGFNQLAAQVIKPGTIAEMTCLSKPFTIIPMVITDIQMPIASGQLRPTDQMIDIQDLANPGTITARMEPLYEDGLEGVLPGSKCIANAYTNNHELIASGELSTSEFLFYHMVDTVGFVHALLLRIQTLLLPVKTLVFAGH